MFDRRSKIALVVFTVVVLVCGVGFEASLDRLDMYLTKLPVDMQRSFAKIPKSVGSWEMMGEDNLLDDAMVETLGTTRYLDRVYRDATTNTVMHVHLAYYTGLIDPVPHVPDRCFVAAGLVERSLPHNVPLDLSRQGWRELPDRIHGPSGDPYQAVTWRHPFTGERAEVVMPMGDVELRTTEFQDPDQPQMRIHAGYLFLANGRSTPSPDGVRLLAFNLSERRAYYCKVQFTMGGPAGFEEADFVAVVAGFMDEFLPEVMRCLPDWSEVERLDVPDDARTAGAAVGVD